MTLTGKRVMIGSVQGKIVAQNGNGGVFIVADYDLANRVTSGKLKHPIYLSPDELHEMQILPDLAEAKTHLIDAGSVASASDVSQQGVLC